MSFVQFVFKKNFRIIYGNSRSINSCEIHRAIRVIRAIRVQDFSETSVSENTYETRKSKENKKLLIIFRIILQIQKKCLTLHPILGKRPYVSASRSDETEGAPIHNMYPYIVIKVRQSQHSQLRSVSSERERKPTEQSIHSNNIINLN